MNHFSGILLLLFTLVACGESSESAEIPECLDPLYDLFTAENEDCEGAQIAIYQFQGEHVNVFAQGNCISDSSTSVFNNICEEICFLGGIAGFQDCEGVNFYDNASLVNIIWER